MSHSLYLQAHINGGSQEIPTKEVLACFSEFIAAQDDSAIYLEFSPGDSCTIYLDTTSPSIEGLTVSRPCGDDRLPESLFRVMQLGNFVFFEPGGDRFIIPDEAVIQHMPEGMAEALGKAWIATDLDSFMEAYNAGVP
jgi:hypothetical protein